MKRLSDLLETSRVAEESVQRSYALFRWAVAFILVMVLCIVALESWRLAQDYQNAYTAAANSATNLTRAAAQQAEGAILQVDTLLFGVRERMEGDGLEHLDIARLQRLFTGQVAATPQLHGLYVFDEHGHWVVSDKAPMPQEVNVTDREYFLYHQQHVDRGLHIGPVFVSRSTGDQVIPLSRRIDHPDGSFAGVFVGTIDIRYFEDYYANFRVDAKGAFVLALRDGSVLVKHPVLEGGVSNSLANGEVYRNRLPYGPEGVIQMVSVVDNQPRLYGYKALHDLPLVMEAGISTESIVQGWTHDLFKTVVIVLVMLLGMGVFSYFFLQQLRSKIVMAEALQVAHTAVQDMAMRDGLTGLGNRRLLDRHLDDEVARARRSGLPLSLIMLDLDFFKRFNDHYGHYAGDECLRRVASALQATLHRPGDLAVRYGGEELAVLIPDTDAVGATVLVEQILDAIRALAIAHADSPFTQVTASAGLFVSTAVLGELTAAAMIQGADAALYKAKQNGRDQWFRGLAVED
ncbi:sensor domain-containing diguanylate cyclase [Pseudomonas sp. dw_358]|uniref:GGDEF domain-containing protein n=1 Tax=Pseudomonas sp. dw_358 TaxID=2720083 RepID=UPI001BD6505C|nr:sensor domain-containing diguanylate cyclase [Pseudomonas sp. dw_358]